jgi:hypothetical protein
VTSPTGVVVFLAAIGFQLLAALVIGVRWQRDHRAGEAWRSDRHHRP